MQAHHLKTLEPTQKLWFSGYTNQMKKQPCDDYEAINHLNQFCLMCGCTEQEHYPNVTPRCCITCGESIQLARLDALPKTAYCTKCVDVHGPKKVYDPNEICARASQSSQNGFAKSD